MRTTLRNWMRGMGLAAMVMATALFMGTGCESGGGDDDDRGGGGGSVVGTWALDPGSTVTGNPYWYINFKEDGSYTITDNADGSGQRVRGTYSQDGDNVTGPFTNPGVGEGRIDATISNGVLLLDFVEYWHTPNKHVPYAGTKI